MAYIESALSKLNKDELIRIALDMQKTQNSILSDLRNERTDMKNELSELRKNCNKVKADLKVSESVTEAMKNHIIVLERKCAGVMSNIPDVKVWRYLGYHLILKLAT